MIKLKHLLLERVDYIEFAEQLVKQYKLKSKVKITNGPDKADYDVDRDTINIRSSYSSVKDFYITVLHEIDHAKDAKKMGKSKYKKDYEMETAYAIEKGGHHHDDNRYEEKAENWAQKEFIRVWKNKI
ncbi:hypothetical protein HOE22_00135 [Candidatus Woesearchaeota archaeon]|jgi:antirestriction protein ArdC|nr:hypothetical protein [Candidatus Woesearchaeota archaeon]MBT4730506.1 hypothetical protein [Candidatus Woesearchaeota archaeon]MBT5760225.1 hypothetical protein [Candidatus Neomarinimicrobiota bacterium]MBT7555759.1 hypothetical protein [Candidatus Woesearchaeota archaeon]